MPDPRRPPPNRETQHRWHDVLSGSAFAGMLELDGLVQLWLLRADDNNSNQ